MTKIHLDGKSSDTLTENIYKLKDLFPGICGEDGDGKIDFDKLKNELGEYVDDAPERYGFTWPGKTKANKESQKRSSGTLRPLKEKSKNWDTTKNVFIEGENLEILKLLHKGYHDKISCIYIDPPYNTGNDFIYKDDYADNLQNYLKLSGQVVDSEDSSDEKPALLTSNPETDGRFHSNWLNMMYPRLKLARTLLKEDGVLFVSIDENELATLRMLLNEVFGEDNYLTTITIKQRHENRILKGDKDFHEVTEFCLVYKKGSKYTQYKRKKDNTSIDDYIYSVEEIAEPTEIIEMGNKKVEVFSPDKYILHKHDKASVNYLKKISIRGSLKDGNSSGRFYMKHLNNIPENYGWLYKVPNMGKDRFDFRYFMKPQSEKIVNGSYFQGVPVDKEDYIDVPYPNFLDLVDTFNNVGYEGEIPFRNGKKPIGFLKHLLELAGLKDDKDALVLDFFAGSGSLAHALMDFNKEDNGNRKFILVQIPAELTEKDEAYVNYNLKDICELAEERIRISGDKIVEESGNKDLDIGFKVFRLDSSNLEKWDPDYKRLEESLIENQIKEDRTNEDLIYEIMIKHGVDLTSDIEKQGHLYLIKSEALIICLDENITREITTEILNIANDSSDYRVVFKDSVFASDEDKTNIKQILQESHISEVITY